MILSLKNTLNVMDDDVTIDDFLIEMSKIISIELFEDSKEGKITQTPQVTTFSHASFFVRRRRER
jgi:hypothetical protein